MVDITFEVEWKSLVSEYLRVSRIMYSTWSSVLSYVHSCEQMVTEKPDACIAKLDTALEEARQLERTYQEYVISLKMMRDYVQSYLLDKDKP